MDHEYLSEETDESPMFDDSEKNIHDISPTTPIHPEHEEHDFEKNNENLSLSESIAPVISVDKSSQETTLSEEMETKAKHLDKELAQETSIPAFAEDKHTGEEPSKDPSTSELPKKDEAQHQPISTTIETEGHIENAPPYHATSMTAELESSEEENAKEKPQETPGSSIAGAEEASDKTASDPSHADEIEPGSVLKEEVQEPLEGSEKKVEGSPDKELLDTPLPAPMEPEITAELAAQESHVAAKLKELTSNQIPEASKELSKPTASDREKRALDVLKRSRYQFRIALDVFLQLINENEDDEGIIRLNLVARDSDLRKAVGMLGLKLQSLTDAEKDLDWAQLLDRYEAKKEQE
jgi:hypothetical protein